MIKEKELQFTPIEFPQLGDAFIHYFVEKDYKKAQTFLLEKGYDYQIKGSGLTIVTKGKDPIVWMKNRKAHIVAHEMIHAIRHILKGLGNDTITDDNDEIFAYLVDYSISQVIKK